MTDPVARSRLLVFTAVCMTASVVSGCSWFGVSEARQTLEKGASAPVVIPEELDEPAYVDLMPIPDIVDYRGLSDREFEVGLPEALATNFDVEQIIIRRLGDERWVFLDRPIAMIWPQVLLFFEEHELPLAMQDAGSGTLDTEWLVGSQGTADEIFDSLEAAAGREGDFPVSQYKFRVSVEPGVRSGSTELHVDQKESPVGSPLRPDAVDWSTESDNLELEDKLLSALAYYLGARITEDPAVSLLAAGLQETKATLVTEAPGMILKYRLDFNRAWATVGAALEDAQISVEDLDRSLANYYVTYVDRRGFKPGFFRRLLSSDKNGGDGDYKFRVHLESSGEEVHVTVVSEGNEFPEADPTERLLLSERLLKLIKEHST